MPVTARINASQLGRYERRLAARFPESTRQGNHAAGVRCVQFLQQMSAHIKDTGEFQDSWDFVATARQLRVFNKSAHGIFVEDGRKPGSRMPPDAPIREWAKRHGIDETRIFALRKAIGLKGIGPRRVMSDAHVRQEVGSMAFWALQKHWAMTLEGEAHG